VAAAANEVNGMTTPTMTWTKLARRLGTDHNPLRRRADIVAAWLLPAALAAFLVLGPLVGWAAAGLAHRANAATWQADRALHRAPATLLAAAPGPAYASASTWMDWTAARWTQGGEPRTALVPTAAGTPQGARVQVWLDPKGRVAVPPLSAGQATERVQVTTALALAALALLLGVAAAIVRARLTRAQITSWAADWRAVEPLWSRLE
jgi:hypothetical protein